MILDENDSSADRAIFDTRYAVSNDMRVIESQHTHPPNLYPSAQIIHDRPIPQAPTTTTPTTTSHHRLNTLEQDIRDRVNANATYIDMDDELDYSVGNEYYDRSNISSNENVMSNDMRVIESQHTHPPNLYPSAQIIHDRPIPQAPTTTTPTTSDDRFYLDYIQYLPYEMDFEEYLIHKGIEKLKFNQQASAQEIKNRKRKRRELIPIEEYDDDLLLKTHQLKKHQRDIRINSNYQPSKKDSTEYTLEERFKKYPYVRYEYITQSH